MINTHTYMYTQINTQGLLCILTREKILYFANLFQIHLPLLRSAPLAALQLLPLYPTLLLPPADLPTQDSRASLCRAVSPGVRLGDASALYGFFRQWPVRHAVGGQTDPTSKWSGNSNLEYVMQRKLAFWLESEKSWLESQASQAACAILSKYTITQSLRCW